MKTDNSKCFGCSKNEVEYLQIEDIQSSYALCKACFEGKKENIKSKYLIREGFLKKYEERLKKEFPNYSKVISFKQNMDKLKFWEKQLKPYIEDALLFIKNKNYTQQNFQLLGTFIQKKGRTMDKSANLILNYLNANKFEISNPMQFTEQNKNDKFKERFNKYLQEIIQKQQLQDIIKYIDAEIENKLSKIPEEFQKVGYEFKNDDADQKEHNKYFGYLNLFDLKNGKGILKKKDIIYYGIFDCDIFIYGVKFEQISKDEGQFFFGQFVREEIQGFGKMLAYKFDNQIMYQEYEGNFENGLRNGKGKFTWKQNNKTLIYEGDWNKNLQHGEGTISNLTSNKNVQYEEGKLKQDQQVQNNVFPGGFQQFLIENQSQNLLSQKFSPGNLTLNQTQNQFSFQKTNPFVGGGMTINKSAQPNPQTSNGIQSTQIQAQAGLSARVFTQPTQTQFPIDQSRQTLEVSKDSFRFQTPSFQSASQTQQQYISSQSTQVMPCLKQETVKFNTSMVFTTQQQQDQQQFKKIPQQSDVQRLQMNLNQSIPIFQLQNKVDAPFKPNNNGLANRQTLSYQ